MSKEHKIGDTFKYGEKLLKVEEDVNGDCPGCFFWCPSRCSRPIGEVEFCSRDRRADEMDVIFKEVPPTIDDATKSVVASAVDNVDFAYIIAHRTNDGEVVINTIGKPENIGKLKSSLLKILKEEK